MRYRQMSLVLAVALAPAAAGCWVKEEVGRKMQADIAAAQVELEVIKKAHGEEKADLQKRIQEADAKIAELEKIIDDYRRATGRSAADIGVDLERIRSELMEVRGRVEVNEHRLGMIEKRMAMVHKDLDQRREGALGQSRGEAEKEDRMALREPEKASVPLPELTRPEKREEFYKLAFGLLEAGQNVAARTLFDEFLKKWPADDYSDNALYWIAESYYVEKKYREAALAFQQVRARFPKGDKAPDALLKLGFCFYNMQRYKEALPFLQEFVRSHPKNKMVSRAQQLIREANQRVKNEQGKGGK